MKQLLRRFKQISVLILAIAFIGCEEDDVILPKVVAGFTYTISTNTGAVTFINTSEKTTNYSWDFGDGTSSTLINPVKVYPSGTYTVVLEASNAAGASATFEDDIVINIPLPINLPVNFDDPNVNYDVTAFSGTAFEIVDNPDASGSNTSTSKVGAITNSGAAFEGIFFDLGMPLDLTTLKSIKVNFWSDTAVDALLKLEEGTGADVETTASHGGTGWEEIYFTFNSSDSFSRFTFFVDGPGTTAGTFYIDDITQIETPAGPCTAETSQSLDATDFNLTFQTDPGTSIGSFDAQLTTVSNPDFDNAVNSSCQVGQIDRNGGALFANNQIEFDTKLDFNANAGFKMKVWSPAAGTNVLVKLEDKADAGINVEVGTTTSTASAWEELTFDFASGESGKYDKIILFFELNTNTTETYYIDDFMLYAGGGSGAVCTPETTESIAAADLNITFQTNTPSVIEDNATFAWIDNPDFAGSVNTSCKVGQVTRANNSPFDNIQIDLADKLDFNASEGIKMKVWSPVPNTPVLLKLEEIGNPGNFVEILQTTSVANGWEELTYDFSPTGTPQFNKLVIFFNFNVADGSTYYFDDLMVYSGGGTGGTTAPTNAPTTPPARDAADVISIYGEAYGAEVGLANVDWDVGSTFAEETIAGNKLLKVDFNDFLGTQLNSVVDATEMTNFHMDLWIVDEFAAGQILNPKWSNHTGGAGETNAFEYTNPIGDTDAKKWISIDVPITDFTGDNTRADLTQFLLAVASTIDVAYVDNIYFYKTGGGGGSATAPTNAPTAPPARDAADVISIYGEAYGAEVGLANVDWDVGSTFAEETIAGNKLLKVDFNDFLGTQLNSVVDATEMTNFHMDLWILDEFAAGQILNPKWSNHTGGAGETNAFEYTNPIGDTDAKKWISIDVPITDFTGDNTRADLTQFLLAVASTIDVAYVDNIYFYKSGSGGTGTGGELTVNGDFETGDISSWTTFVDAQGASFAASGTDPSTGSFSGNLIADFEAGTGAAVDAVVKQANLGAGGGVTPNTEYVVTFDLRGSAADGGVFFAEFFSELSGGGTSKAEILTGGPHPLTTTWTTYSYTVVTGPDVSGGITLQMKSSCGPVANCLVDVFFDNVSIKLK